MDQSHFIRNSNEKKSSWGFTSLAECDIIGGVEERGAIL